MTIHKTMLYAPLMPSPSDSGQAAARTRVQHYRVAADGRLTRVESDAAGGCRTVEENRPNPFSLLATREHMHAPPRMDHGGASVPDLPEGTASLAHTPAGPAAAHDTAPGEMAASAKEGDDDAGAPGLGALQQEASCQSAAPTATPEGNADLEQLQKFVLQWLKHQDLQSGSIDIALGDVLSGFDGTVMSLQRHGAMLAISCRCNNDPEAAWFGRHATTLATRLAQRLCQSVAIAVNGEAPVFVESSPATAPQGLIMK